MGVFSVMSHLDSLHSLLSCALVVLLLSLLARWVLETQHDATALKVAFQAEMLQQCKYDCFCCKMCLSVGDSMLTLDLPATAQVVTLPSMYMQQCFT